MAAISGTVKMVDYHRKYGFIHGEDGLDYSFHKDECDESMAYLTRGDGVMFEPSANARGPIAERVTAYPDGG
jgi:cold shock CspA family protein